MRIPFQSTSTGTQTTATPALSDSQTPGGGNTGKADAKGDSLRFRVAFAQPGGSIDDPTGLVSSHKSNGLSNFDVKETDGWVSE